MYKDNFHRVFFGLEILKKFVDKDSTNFGGVQAEHDCIFTNVTLDECPTYSEEGVNLVELGWTPSDFNTWMKRL